MSGVPARLSAALADRYRIERELGQGGMATVYLCEDVKHKRKVALKLLKPELAAVLGAERFVQEITTTAALQHPHILPLFDSGEADGFLYYVMPFIDGETLRAKLDRETQLGVEEAVRIASDVASALHYAHTHGVIHRDIKPENILLHDGRPMVADFGIALAVSAAAGGRMTETGLSLGTPHYMSPEQATAEKEITARSDVYSLGSVLYEVLTGDPPHTGSSAQQIIMKIITEPAALVTKLRKSVPPNVAAAVAKALEKLPADRFASAKAFADALGDPGFRDAATRVVSLAGASTERDWRTIALALGAIAALTAGALAWRSLRADSSPRDVGLPPNAPLQAAGQFRNFAVAPDGSFVVYLARVGAETQLWVRDLHGDGARPIPGTEGAGGTPRISPDGQKVAFQAGGDLKVATLAGGAVSTFAKGQDPQGGEWTADGKLFVGELDGNQLRWIDIATGAVREVQTSYCLNPQLIPGDRVICGGGAQKFAMVRRVDRPRESILLRLAAGAADGGSPYLLGSHFRLIDERYVVYMSLDGTLMGTRIVDPESLTVGRPVPLVPLVRRSAYSGVGQYDLTVDGTLIYMPGLNADLGRLVMVGRDGRAEPLPVEEEAFLRFTPSPDGKRIAAVVEGTQRQELRVYDLASGGKETQDTGFYLGAPAWSPDGRSLAYVKSDDPDHARVLLRQLDSPGAPQELAALAEGVTGQVSSFARPDLLLVGSGSTLGMLAIDPNRTPASIDTVPLQAYFATISPDRRWIAYQTPGTTGVYLQPWPALDRRYLVSPDGTEPRWSTANEILFLSQYRVSGLMAASIFRTRVGEDPRAPVGASTLITRDPLFNDTPGWSHAPTRDGGLIYLQSPSENLGHYIRVVPDWVKQMKRAVDAADR